MFVKVALPLPRPSHPLSIQDLPFPSKPSPSLSKSFLFFPSKSFSFCSSLIVGCACLCPSSRVSHFSFALSSCCRAIPVGRPWMLQSIRVCVRVYTKVYAKVSASLPCRLIGWLGKFLLMPWSVLIFLCFFYIEGSANVWHRFLMFSSPSCAREYGT